MTTETEVITRPDGTTGTAGGNAGQNVGTTTGGNTANGDAQGTTEVPDEDVPLKCSRFGTMKMCLWTTKIWIVREAQQTVFQSMQQSQWQQQLHWRQPDLYMWNDLKRNKTF